MFLLNSLVRQFHFSKRTVTSPLNLSYKSVTYSSFIRGTSCGLCRVAHNVDHIGDQVLTCPGLHGHQRLRMKLHRYPGQNLMCYGHDTRFRQVRMSNDLQTLRHLACVQGVITSGLKFLRQTCKQGMPLMSYQTRFTMHLLLKHGEFATGIFHHRL